MTAKCNCNHCSAHLEFDSASAGSVTTCPTCGMDTTLYVPAQKPFAPITNRPAIPSSSAETLKQIRQQSCYGTLRRLIDLVQYIIFAIAALLAIGAVTAFFIGSSSRRIVEMSASAKYWFKQAAKTKIKTHWQMPYDKRRFRLRKLRDALGFEKWPQDLLRHSCASYMLAAEGDVGRVAKFLGNSVTVVLNHYQELVSKADGLRFQNLKSRG
jgi:integrase